MQGNLASSYFSTRTKDSANTNIVLSLQPQAKLQWKKCADMPVKMERPQVVVMGEKVYVGGGHTKQNEDAYQVVQYNPSRDEWSCLPPCQVTAFAMA